MSTQYQPDSSLVFTDERDGNDYHYISLNGLYWFTENLRFKPDSATHEVIVHENEACGEFYSVESEDDWGTIKASQND
jgi:uncharacterized protein (TIGR02145 family)